jgi:hypothetical protein
LLLYAGSGWKVLQWPVRFDDFWVSPNAGLCWRLPGRAARKGQEKGNVPELWSMTAPPSQVFSSVDS